MFADTPDILYKPSGAESIPSAYSVGTACVNVCGLAYVKRYSGLEKSLLALSFVSSAPRSKTSQVPVCSYIHYHPLWVMRLHVCACVCLCGGDKDKKQDGVCGRGFV